MTIEPSKFSTQVLGDDAVVFYDGELVGVLSPHMLKKAEKFVFKPIEEWPATVEVTTTLPPDDAPDSDVSFVVSAAGYAKSGGVTADRYTDSKGRKWIYLYDGNQRQLAVVQTRDEAMEFVRDRYEPRNTPGAMLRHLFPHWGAIKEME